MLRFDSLETEDDAFGMNPGRTSRPAFTSDPIFPVSVARYHAIVGAGLLNKSHPVELLNGVLTLKKRKTPLKTSVVGATRKLLSEHLGDAASVHQYVPITCDDSEPEPDLAVTGFDAFNDDQFPTPADVLLVIEVIDRQGSVDRFTKQRLYARVGIPAYWIIDARRRCIEVYGEPRSKGRGSKYASRVLRTVDGTIALPATLGGATIAVADLLPPA